MNITWLFLIFLSLPSFWIRFSTMHRKEPWRISLLISYFTGICQDLFVAFQQLFLFVLIKETFPGLHPYLMGVGILLSTLAQAHLISDHFLQRKTGVRLEVSFFSLFRDVRFFWDSAKEKKVWRFVPIALAFFAFPIWVYWNTLPELAEVTFQKEWLALGVILACLGTVGHFFLPRKLAYVTDHIIFQSELWYVRKLFRFIKRKSDGADLNHLARACFESPSEKKHFPTSEYPLLKYTQGFTGEKTFNLTLKEGEKPHVIFLFLESFRARNVGALGANLGASPHFDRLAREGILFTNFYANSVRTSRTVLSSLYGLPSDIDGSEVAARAEIPFTGIPHLLKEKGYQTSYLHNGPLEFENQEDFFNLNGFETVKGQKTLRNLFPKAHSSSWGVPDECLMHYAANFLEKRKETPQFLTLFTISNHHLWNLPEHYQPPAFPKEISRIYRKYLNTFHYSDACLGLLIELLKEKKLLDNTLFFILGDHGYPMGEHDNFVQQRYLYEENIHVPLLIYGKGRIQEAKKLHAPASQLDLVPTVMDLLGLTGFNHAVGHSLLRESEERKIFFHNPYVFKNFGCRYGTYKFIHTRMTKELELYDLESDPEEKTNVASHHEALSRTLLQSVNDYKRFFLHFYGEKKQRKTGSYCAAPLH